MADPAAAHSGAAFRLAFDGGGRRGRALARLANWRARAFGLPYGDQGLIVSRRFYEHLGGYRPLPLMEDVDLVRRIGAAHMRILDAEAVTSARRYAEGGWIRRPLRNLVLLGLYFAGVPPRLLARGYG